MRPVHVQMVAVQTVRHNVNAASEKILAICFWNFEVFHKFFGIVVRSGMHSDSFECFRMRSDALGCFLEAFRCIRTFSEIFGFSGMSSIFLNVSRHFQMFGTCNLVCPCGSADFTLQHALCHCPRMSTLRRTWASHVGLGCASPALVAAAASSNWLFDLEDGRNSRGIMTAHIIYVGRVCDWAKSQ